MVPQVVKAPFPSFHTPLSCTAPSLEMEGRKEEAREGSRRKALKSADLAHSLRLIWIKEKGIRISGRRPRLCDREDGVIL